MDCFRFSLPSILVDMTRNRCLNFCGARMMFLEHFNPSQRFLLENHFGSSSQIGCNKKSAVDHQTENHLSLTPRFHPFLRLGYRWQSQGHTWVRNVVMLSKRYQGKSCCTNLLLFQELWSREVYGILELRIETLSVFSVNGRMRTHKN